MVQRNVFFLYPTYFSRVRLGLFSQHFMRFISGSPFSGQKMPFSPMETAFFSYLRLTYMHTTHTPTQPAKQPYTGG